MSLRAHLETWVTEMRSIYKYFYMNVNQLPNDTFWPLWEDRGRYRAGRILSADLQKSTMPPKLHEPLTRSRKSHFAPRDTKEKES